MLSIVNILSAAWWLLPPLLIVGIVGLLFYRRRVDREPNLVKRGFRLFRLNLLLFGIYAVFLGLLIFPLSPILSRVGYPDTVENIQSAEQLREYLHTYNQVLARPTKQEFPGNPTP